MSVYAHVHVCASTCVYAVVTYDGQKLSLVFSMDNLVYFVIYSRCHISYKIGDIL